MEISNRLLRNYKINRSHKFNPTNVNSYILTSKAIKNLKAKNSNYEDLRKAIDIVIGIRCINTLQAIYDYTIQNPVDKSINFIYSKRHKVIYD